MMQDPEKAPRYITDAIENSSYEGTFGAPLDRLITMKKTFEDKTDEEKDKLRKVTSYMILVLTPLNYLLENRGRQERRRSNPSCFSHSSSAQK